jgi:hypothetical protein
MSFTLTLSKITDSADMIQAPGAVIRAEGLALVRQANAQSAGVLPSTGQAGEIFAGFAMAGTSAAPFLEAMTNKVETFVVPTTGVITLSRPPVTGQTFVFDNTLGEAVTSPAVSGSQVSGLTAGDEVTVTYKYALTVLEARAIFGDVEPGGYSGDYISQIGVAKRGLLYTGEFDASVNWEAATAIKLAPGGQLTDQTGSGVTIPATVVAVPGVEYPYLGIEFSAV